MQCTLEVFAQIEEVGHTSEFRRQYGGSPAAVRRQYGGSPAAVRRQYSDNTYIRILIQLFHDFDG